MTTLRHLRRRLVLETAERAPDGSGGCTETWIPVATLWARMETLAGREAVHAEATTAEATHRVTIRGRSGLGTPLRFREGARTFEIVAVIEDERRRWTACLCRERPAP